MTTRIVAIRHAKPLSEGYAEDSLRPLSDEGKEVQKQLTEKLYAIGIRPTHILTSPLLRAQQTAQIATDIFEVPFKDEAALGDDFDGNKLLQSLPPPDENATVFLVGHAPTLGDFVNKLVGREALPDGLSKSTAAIVDFEAGVTFGEGTFIDYIKP